MPIFSFFVDLLFNYYAIDSYSALSDKLFFFKIFLHFFHMKPNSFKKNQQASSNQSVTKKNA
jgi:hypothetical protein